MSHREVAARLQWLEDQWNEPSRTDYYLMQVALESFFSHRKRPKDPLPSDWKIPFKFEKRDQPANKPKTREQATAWAKARWFGLVGVTRDVIKRALGKGKKKDE